MAKIYDGIEIGMTRSELRQALRCWMDRKTLIANYRVTDIVIRADAKYVVRFTVEPPLENEDRKAVEANETQAAEK
jgi:hypothetical protein